MSRFDPVVFRRTSFSCASALKPALLLRSLRDTSENWWNGKPKNQMVLSWRNVSILKYLLNYTIHWYKTLLFCPACLKKAAFFFRKAVLTLSCPASARLSGHEVGQCCWCLNQGVSIFLRNHLVQVQKKSHHKTTGVLPINFDAVSEVKRNPRASCKK